MDLTISTTVEAIRKAIDDIAPTQLTDTFAGDTDAELKQALLHSVEAMLQSVSLLHIEPLTLSGTDEGATVDDGDNESTVVVLPKGFLRFAKVKLAGWLCSVTELMEAGSDGEKMQRTCWGRGSASKPRAMLDSDAEGSLVLRCWPSGDLELLSYVPTATESEGTLTCALRPECEKSLIYLAASIFLEGKKEGALADRFRQMYEALVVA